MRFIVGGSSGKAVTGFRCSGNVLPLRGRISCALCWRFCFSLFAATADSVLGAIAVQSWLTHDVQGVYLTSLFMHYFAVFGLYLFWSMMLHSVGLPAPGDEARMLQEKLDRASVDGVVVTQSHEHKKTASDSSQSGSASLHTLSKAATNDKRGLEVPLLSSGQKESLSSTELDRSNSSSLGVRPVHQVQGYPWSFYIPKLATMVAMWLGLVASWAYFPTYSWAFASKLRGTGPDSEDDERALAALYMAFRICTGIYFLWCVIAFNRAYQRLRALPYLETRFRQLSFHFFVFHGTWVIAFVLITYVWQSLRPASALSDEGTVPSFKHLICSKFGGYQLICVSSSGC